MGGEAAYLSLSRGEGGQNLVGPDLGVGLGLVRSQELGAARRLDGGRQYFTRAYDFGFTRSLEETFPNWPREALLEDAVRVMRRFRPQVVVSIFSGTTRDGHGQHQAAGVTAQDAFRVGGRPRGLSGPGRRRADALAAAGALPGDRLVRQGIDDGRSADRRRGRADGPFLLPDRDGQPQPPSLAGHGPPAGPGSQGDGASAGSPGARASDGKDLFAGVDTRLAAIAAEVPDAGRRAEMEKRLDRVAALSAETRKRLSTPDLPAVAPLLAEILGELRAARALTKAGRRRRRHAPRREDRSRRGRPRGRCRRHPRRGRRAGDGRSGRESRRDRQRLERRGLERGGRERRARQPRRVERRRAGGGAHRRRGPARGMEGERRRPGRRRPTLPYFLYKPLAGDLYDWTDTPASERGEPFAPAALRASVRHDDRGRARRRSSATRRSACATRRSARSGAPCAPFRRSTSPSSRACSSGPSRRTASVSR